MKAIKGARTYANKRIWTLREKICVQKNKSGKGQDRQVKTGLRAGAHAQVYERCTDDGNKGGNK